MHVLRFLIGDDRSRAPAAILDISKLTESDPCLNNTPFRFTRQKMKTMVAQWLQLSKPVPAPLV
jgi:hypothetical protein